MLNPTQLATLKAFLDANTATYAALDDQTAAETLNALTESRIKASITGAEIFAATDPAEFDLKPDAQRQEWLALCSIDSIAPTNASPAAAIITRIFGNPSNTFTNLQALRTETISPATSQGLPRVRAEDVRIARTL